MDKGNFWDWVLDFVCIALHGVKVGLIFTLGTNGMLQGLHDGGPICGHRYELDGSVSSRIIFLILEVLYISVTLAFEEYFIKPKPSFSHPMSASNADNKRICGISARESNQKRRRMLSPLPYTLSHILSCSYPVFSFKSTSLSLSLLSR